MKDYWFHFPANFFFSGSEMFRQISLRFNVLLLKAEVFKFQSRREHVMARWQQVVRIPWNCPGSARDVLHLMRVYLVSRLLMPFAYWWRLPFLKLMGSNMVYCSLIVHTCCKDAASFYAGMNTTTSLEFQKQPAKLKPTEQRRVGIGNFFVLLQNWICIRIPRLKSAGTFSQ